MINQLLHLPYVTYWLPVLAALTFSLPFCLWLRGSRGEASPATQPPPDAGAAAPKATEQRRSFRRGGNPLGIHYKRPGQKDGAVQASLVDRSMGGVCLLTHESIAVGTALSIRPANAEEIIPWVEVEVCVCRPNDDEFEVGCRFIKTPPYSILLLFG